MRGLTEVEWDVLNSASYPDPCDEEWECGDWDDEQEAAEARLVARGLIVIIPCEFDPTSEHPSPTALGHLVLRIGRSVFVGGTGLHV